MGVQNVVHLCIVFKRTRLYFWLRGVTEARDMGLF